MAPESYVAATSSRSTSSAMLLSYLGLFSSRARWFLRQLRSTYEINWTTHCGATLSFRCPWSHPMLDEFPLPEGLFATKTVAYRVPRPRDERKRELAPEILEIIRRVEEAKIREYFKRRRAS